MAQQGGTSVEMFSRARDLFRIRSQQEPSEVRPNYQALMEDALRRVRIAELQIREATTVEDLDIGRSQMMAAWAEVQQLIRTAKREQGIAVRPVSETEELYRNLREHMKRPRRAQEPGPERNASSQ